MLTLDHTTLFYWTLSDTSKSKDKFAGIINDWASKVPQNSKPPSKARSKSNSIQSASTPSLTNASTVKTGRSALRQDVKITDHGVHDDVDIISDLDETIGKERDAAKQSPDKGRQRVTSSVSHREFM
jgi:hypothetical protein